MAGSEFFLDVNLILLAQLRTFFSFELLNALGQQLGIDFLKVFDLLDDLTLEVDVEVADMLREIVCRFLDVLSGVQDS